MVDRAAGGGAGIGAVEARACGNPVRVGIDGPPASGKTTLADELAGGLRFRPAVYDRTRDCALHPAATTAGAGSGLVFDGVFLMRPELEGRWDLRVYASVAAEVSIARALVREVLVEPTADVGRRWRERYLSSQRLYDAEVRPQEVADVVVVNDDPQQPRWRFRVPEVCATERRCICGAGIPMARSHATTTDPAGRIDDAALACDLLAAVGA